MKLDDHIRELIAVGASITANCQPCLEYHVARALESGATQEEVGEAIEVGKIVRRGAASKLDRLIPTLVTTPLPCATTADHDCGSGS